MMDIFAEYSSTSPLPFDEIRRQVIQREANLVATGTISSGRELIEKIRRRNGCHTEMLQRVADDPDIELYTQFMEESLEQAMKR